MRVGGHAPSSSLSLHLDPKRARMMVNVELGVSMGDDAAIYLCVVLQHTIERLVAGALTSCGKPELRTKYGGTGKAVQPGADVQPRHLQDYIRTDSDTWSLFNSAFAFQVILSVFLDHATEMFFQRVGLPIHSKGALASCEYYATVIDGLQQQKKSCRLPAHSNNGGNPPAEELLVTTPAQLARVAARVNPLCSLSPKACLMVEALTHEMFMALCEGVIQRRADTRVITIVDLEGGIRDVFPERLALEAALAGKEAILTLSGGPAAASAAGEPADDQVRLCVRRLQGTRTLLRKNFRVSPGSLLFTVFTRACERLRIKESSVIFVHDGTILSGRQKAGTLLSAGRRVVQVFAVCKRAWACRQRAAARRGLLLENAEPSRSAAQARKKYDDDSAHDLREKPWRQPHMPPQVVPRTRPAANGLHDVALHRPLPPVHPPPENVFHSPPPGMGTQSGGEAVGGVSRPPRPRQSKRWIATPVEGAKLDLGRLENAHDPFPRRQRTGTFATGLSGSASTEALVGSTGARGVGGAGAGAAASPRIKRTVRRLSAMEACLRNLEDSMKELQSGDLNGRQSGISSVAMAAITSQLDVAYNLSSLCRQVLSSAHAGERQLSQASQPAAHSSQDRIATQSQLHGRVGRAQQRDSSFLTEVPAEPRREHARNTVPPPAGRVREGASPPVDVSSPGKAAHDDGRMLENQALARQASRTKTSPDPPPAARGGAQTRPPIRTAIRSSEIAPRRHQAAVPPEEVPSSWSPMVSEQRHDLMGNHPSSIPEESSTWSGYISEFQPATPETTLTGLSEEGERTQPQSYGTERGGSGEQRPGRSGGEALVAKNVSEGSHGGGGRHRGLASDGDYERDSAVLNADSGTGSGDTDGRRSGSIAGVGGGSGEAAIPPRGLPDAIPLEVRPSSGVLAPRSEPRAEAEDPYADGDWDDAGDDAGDDDGNWSSWLTSGGGGEAVPSSSDP